MGVVGGGGGDAVDEVLVRVVFEVGGAVGELTAGGVLEENFGFAGEDVFREVCNVIARLRPSANVTLRALV